MKSIKGCGRKLMGIYEIEFLPAAYSDLDEIFDYIMADSPIEASKILDIIMSSLQRLEKFPHSGAPLLDRIFKQFSFRMVIIEPYIAFYRVIEDKVFVYRILHGSRNYSHLLKEIQ
jgi:toxin ParE1/3/4